MHDIARQHLRRVKDHNHLPVLHQMRVVTLHTQATQHQPSSQNAEEGVKVAKSCAASHDRSGLDLKITQSLRQRRTGTSGAFSPGCGPLAGRGAGSVAEVARGLTAEFGPAWLYRGMGPTLLRAFVINAVNFAVFERLQEAVARRRGMAS